ncbi:recombination-associated protein RdgC [Castellaniella sp.]|uniref:recombination-associated protein RdgC n=1 Tax=Castellaniella sp. TaxID=1955812 RepID=UPI002AFFC243|nr:recombination-associated protein RdgC [Castellaniella sp.]
MFFKNLKIYLLSPTVNFDADTLAQALQNQSFAPASSQDAQVSGFVSPCEHASNDLVHAVGKHYLVCLCTEKKLLPSSVVNEASRARALEIEEQQGYKPGRKQMKDIKEQITMELLPRAFSLKSNTYAWFDMENHRFIIEAAAAGKADEMLGLLAKCLSPYPIVPLHVEMSPGAAMTGWLTSDEAPPGFSIDQDTQLQSTGESRATVRYTRQSVETEEVRRHVQAGKQCTQLAMTWNDRVSFVLTENLDVKRVAPLDVLKEHQDAQAQNEAEQFDADMALMTGELARTLADVIAALGGQRQDA